MLTVAGIPGPSARAAAAAKRLRAVNILSCGIGLPIAKNLVDMHGGTFTLKSKVRIGTELIATFPPERVMAALPPLSETAPPVQPQHPQELNTPKKNRRSLFKMGA